MVSLSDHRLKGFWLAVSFAVRVAVSFGGPSEGRGEKSDFWKGGSGLVLTCPYEKSGSRGRFGGPLDERGEVWLLEGGLGFGPHLTI